MPRVKMPDEQKKRSHNVMMSQEIERYIQRMEGQSFSEKFGNLIIWCMKREEVLHALEQRYDKQIKEKDRELADLENKIMSRREILNDIEELTKEISNMRGKTKDVINKFGRYADGSKISTK